MKKILVIGFGTMGKGITKFFLQNDYRVDVLDTRRTEEKFQTFKETLEKERIKGKIKDDEYAKMLNNLNVIDDMKFLENEYYICIEAVRENIEDKIKLYNELENYLDYNTILATNTSSIKINDLSKGLKYKKRFLGVHFFNPADKMPLIELSKTSVTDIEKYDEIKKFLESLGKNVIEVKDSSGFIVNRILIKSINEAALLVEENVCNLQEIDQAMKTGAGWPMGPFELADFIGIDVCLNILENFQNYFDGLRISNILYEKVNNNELGRKTKMGFYEYR